jgi:predicted nucleic acid-binding protein
VRTLIVDASVAVKWLVLEDMSDVAKELYGTGDHLVAPRLITTEIANALARKTIQGMLTPQEAKYHFSSLRQFLPDLIDVDELIEPALENSCILRHPIYDLIYLEAARRLDAQLVTADRRLAAKVAGTDLARHLTLLSDWRPE